MNAAKRVPTSPHAWNAKWYHPAWTGVAPSEIWIVGSHVTIV